MSETTIRFRPVVLNDDVLIVVSFFGSLDLTLHHLVKDYQTVIHQYLDVGAVVLDFTEAPNIHAEAFSAITNLQRLIRDKGIEVRVCGVLHTMQRGLVNHGVFRQADVFANLETALFPKSEIDVVHAQIKKAA